MDGKIKPTNQLIAFVLFVAFVIQILCAPLRFNFSAIRPAPRRRPS